MLDREEAIVLIAIINEYDEDLKKLLREEDYDIITSLNRQMQNRLNIKEQLTF